MGRFIQITHRIHSSPALASAPSVQNDECDLRPLKAAKLYVRRRHNPEFVLTATATDSGLMHRVATAAIPGPPHIKTWSKR